MEDTHTEEEVVDTVDKGSHEVAPALIALHPTHDSVSVAVGSDLRIFDLRVGSPVNLVDSGEAFHKDSIRAIRYGASGNFFVSAGDDKLVKIWCAKSWHCIHTVNSEKRVTAVAISRNDLYVCFADKFGVVWAVDLHGLGDTRALEDKKPSQLLAHYCSIITSLEFSPDGRFIVSADRDFKIRVTVFPHKPLDGAHEIQSYCLGHTEFVSCLAFISDLDNPSGCLVSGGGDSTVRLWDITSGSTLDTCIVGAKAGIIESNGSEEEYNAVTDLCQIAESVLVAVAVQSLQGILLLSCDLSAHTLSVAKVISISGENFIPTSLGCSISSSEYLWMITGVSSLCGVDNQSLARVRVISGFKKSSTELVPVVLGDNEIPFGDKLLEKLQGSVCVEEKVISAAAEAVKTAMRNLLIKKLYTAENRDFRKRSRNDRKAKK